MKKKRKSGNVRRDKTLLRASRFGDRIRTISGIKNVSFFLRSTHWLSALFLSSLTIRFLFQKRSKPTRLDGQKRRSQLSDDCNKTSSPNKSQSALNRNNLVYVRDYQPNQKYHLSSSISNQRKSIKTNHNNK